MKQTTRGLLALATLLLGAACASGTGGAASSTGASANAGATAQNRVRSRSDRITLEEIQQRTGYSNLYELVRDLRPRWLQARGTDTLSGRSGQVQVHMDGNRLGPVDALKNLSVSGVTSIEWVAPVDAAGRFGLDHGHGAILVSTRPVR